MRHLILNVSDSLVVEWLIPIQLARVRFPVGELFFTTNIPILLFSYFFMRKKVFLIL